MGSNVRQEKMQPRVINIFELIMLCAWFSSGFVPGYFVAASKGLIPGLIIGFFIFILVLVAYGRCRIALERRGRKPTE